jgi:hypothetical protein
VDVRGRRGGKHYGLSNPRGLLSLGYDCDYRGLDVDTESEEYSGGGDVGVHIRLPVIEEATLRGSEQEEDD